MAGECHFLEAWRFAVPEVSRFAVDPDHHEGDLRNAWFRPIVPGPPVAFTICGAHAREFVRVLMTTRHDVVVR